MKQRCAMLIITAVFIFGVIQSNSDIRTDSKPQSELTVIMYHGFLKDTSKSGTYIITPEQFENDILYLQNNGFNFVSVRDIKDYKASSKPLPKKAVLITIDDGNYNNYCYIYPILKSYRVPALISPIAYWAEKYTQSGEKNPIYSIVTADCIGEMAESGLVEFGNHTYNLHSLGERKGAQRLKSETAEEYRAMLTADLTKAHNIILSYSGEPPCALVFPYGIISSEAYEVARSLGYDIIFSCTEGVNSISPSDGMYILKRYNRYSGPDSAEFFSKLTGD